MSKLDELYRLHRLLDGRRTGISRADLIGTHGFARATLARLIADLRDRVRASLDTLHARYAEALRLRLLEDRDRSLADAAELGSKWNGVAGGRLRYAVAPRFALS